MSINRIPPSSGRARLRLAAFVLACGFVTSITGHADAAPPAPRTVEIRQFAFLPREITVEPGTRVRWTNHDETPHTVTSQAAPKVLASPGMDTDDRFEFVFEREGDFAYLCTVHPMMTGVVHVRRAGGAPH